ncbi:hypothetical protein KIPB_008935, partial [Kipferlia bialata]
VVDRRCIAGDATTLPSIHTYTGPDSLLVVRVDGPSLPTPPLPLPMPDIASPLQEREREFPMEGLPPVDPPKACGHIRSPASLSALLLESIQSASQTRGHGLQRVEADQALLAAAHELTVVSTGVVRHICDSDLPPMSLSPPSVSLARGEGEGTVSTWLIDVHPSPSVHDVVLVERAGDRAAAKALGAKARASLHLLRHTHSAQACNAVTVGLTVCVDYMGERYAVTPLPPRLGATAEAGSGLVLGSDTGVGVGVHTPEAQAAVDVLKDVAKSANIACHTVYASDLLVGGEDICGGEGEGEGVTTPLSALSPVRVLPGVEQYLVSEPQHCLIPALPSSGSASEDTPPLYRPELTEAFTLDKALDGWTRHICHPHIICDHCDCPLTSPVYYTYRRRGMAGMDNIRYSVCGLCFSGDDALRVSRAYMAETKVPRY